MASPRTPDFQDLIARVARALGSRGIPFMLIGGQAVLLHGEPRLTQDIDVTLGAGPQRLDDLLEAAREAALDPLPNDPVAFVRDTYVLPCEEPDTGLRVDTFGSGRSASRRSRDGSRCPNGSSASARRPDLSPHS